MNTDTDKICCPGCAKKKTWTSDNADRPFCSSRCKLIDLGEWASETYSIPDARAALENNLDTHHDKK